VCWHYVFIAYKVAVVGDRLVFVNKSSNIEVRHVHNAGQVVPTIHCNRDVVSEIRHMSAVPDYSDLLVTGGADGDVVVLCGLCTCGTSKRVRI